MKLGFMGVSWAALCMDWGKASSGSKRRVSHMDAFDTTAYIRHRISHWFGRLNQASDARAIHLHR